MEKYLTPEQARKRYCDQKKDVYAVRIDDSGNADRVLKLDGKWVLDWIGSIELQEWEKTSSWHYVTLTQLRLIPNVFCHKDKIQILIDACDR